MVVVLVAGGTDASYFCTFSIKLPLSGDMKDFLQEQSIIGNLNIAPAVNWAGKNSKDYTNLFLEVNC